MTELNAQEIKRLNAVVRFATYSVFKIEPGVLGDRAEVAADFRHSLIPSRMRTW